jgi:hypothetical protein
MDMATARRTSARRAPDGDREEEATDMKDSSRRTQEFAQLNTAVQTYVARLGLFPNAEKESSRIK